jgi:DNA topoisomerase-1
MTTNPTDQPHSEIPGTDPIESAEAAGLCYISDDIPGIRRESAAEGFNYIGPDGQPITAPNTLARIKALAIPPAWTEVWVCPDPRGHLQATGRDARGRKQYRYHRRWHAVRDLTKYHRLLAFGQALPKIRAQVAEDLGRRGLPREKVLATVVRLLEETLIRIGNPEYARANGSFGLTTLRDQHVDISGTKIEFHFRGKSGKKHHIDLRDRRLAQVVKRCRDLPGYELFQYIDDAGQRQKITSNDVNAYLRNIAGEEFSAKDFRTWAGTVQAASILQELGNPDSDQQAKQNITEAVKQVSAQLGNTPAVCRKCYIHPAVLNSYQAGQLRAALEAEPEHPDDHLPHALRPAERAVLTLIQQAAPALS